VDRQLLRLNEFELSSSSSIKDQRLTMYCQCPCYSAEARCSPAQFEAVLIFKMSGEKEQLGCAYLFLDLRKEPCFRNPPKYGSTSPLCLSRPNFLPPRLNLHFSSVQSHKAEYPRSYLVNPIPSSWRIRLIGKVL
jgi:hypothetical protein